LTEDKPQTIQVPPRRRHGWLDRSRGLALLAMASYHLMWDLQSFGYLATDFATTGLPRFYARAIASTFLFLVGLSLVIAQYPQLRLHGFFRRLAMIVGAAGLVSLSTWFLSPGTFIYYGILHSIAVSSLVGLAFLRLPPALTLVAALAAIAAPHFLQSDIFNHPLLWWTGLATVYRRSDDFVPLIPWIGPVLIGIATMRIAVDRNWLARQPAASQPSNRFDKGLTFLGRHSLVFYLIHQPILIGLVAATAYVLPPPAADPVMSYQKSCNASCGMSEAETFCKTFCDCTIDRLMEQNLFTPLVKGEISAKDDTRITRIGAECTKLAF
jgi:uncharacterized membrane protein